MPEAGYRLQLRPTTLEDASLVADLEALRDPQTPPDPALLRHWWRMTDVLESGMRRIAVEDGAALAYVSTSHKPWSDGQVCYGTIRLGLRDDVWTDDAYAYLVSVGEAWMREEGAQVAVARVRQDFERELKALKRLGYRENRRMRLSELDLVSGRERILAARHEARRKMDEQGVAMLVLSELDDPDKYRKLYQMIIESERDIPTTVPWRELSFDEWRSFWFDTPTIREDRFWVACEGDRIVGTSVLDTPLERGIPFTAYTGTLRSVRGRGIARALKYESMGQAIEAGYTRVRTNNDADNPPILRINEEMGYHAVAPLIELHRSLA